MEKIIEKIRNGQILSSAEQLEIVQHKDKRYLRLYIKKHCLCNNAEVALVKLRDVELFSQYLENNGLCPEAEEELLKVRDFKLMKLYFNEYDLAGFSPLEMVRDYRKKNKKF